VLRFKNVVKKFLKNILAIKKREGVDHEKENYVIGNLRVAAVCRTFMRQII